MINRLLGLVAVEKQEQLKNIESFDFVTVLKSVISTKQLQLSKLAINIKTTIPAKLLITGDSFLLAQAIDNLLQNAIDFSHDNDTIAIEIAEKEQINFIIRDQGSSIPSYALDKVFNRFYSLSRPTSHKKSSGLGLCFVKQIAELHHGSVSIKNNQDDGVTAHLLFNKKNNKS
jgi:two-component system sensor histidine kinase CreC